MVTRWYPLCELEDRWIRYLAERLGRSSFVRQALAGSVSLAARPRTDGRWFGISPFFASEQMVAGSFLAFFLRAGGHRLQLVKG